MDCHAIQKRDVDVQLRKWVAIVLLTTLALVTCPTLAWASEQDGGVLTDETPIAIDIESTWATEQNEAASADVVQTSSEDKAVALESCDVQADGDSQSQADENVASQVSDECPEQTDSAVQAPDNELWAASTLDAPEIGFTYTHDPRKNQKAMANIVEDAAAVYGFRPSAEGTLAAYAELDWTDPVVVEGGRQERIAYHESIAEMYEMLYEMQAAGATTEQIARAVSAKRNEIRIASYANDPEGLERLKARNLEVYGNEDGGSPEYFYECYGSWEAVIDKSFSTNSGMDACLGLYDDYYELYVILGQVEPDPEESDPVGEDDETDDGEKTDDFDGGDDAPTSTDGGYAPTSADDGQTHIATAASDVGRGVSATSVQAVPQTVRTLPATGDIDARLPLGLMLASGLMLGLSMCFLKRDVAA